jgi:hypothetical protein
MRTYVIVGLMLALGWVFFAPDLLAQTFVFPEKGQTPEQQEQDDFTCYKWAKQQTGYDPQHPDLTSAPPPPSGGGAIYGAAGGAALGAIGGAMGHRRECRERRGDRRRCRGCDGHEAATASSDAVSTTSSAGFGPEPANSGHV